MKFPEAIEYERDGAKAYASVATERLALEHAGWKKVEKAVRANATEKKAAAKKVEEDTNE